MKKLDTTHESKKNDIKRHIAQLGGKSGLGRRIARLSLAEITGRDFGTDAGAWKRWYAHNSDRFRHEWAADCLEESGYRVRGVGLRAVPACIRAMRNGSTGVRSAANYLLRCLTGRRIPFPVHSSPSLRERCVRKWIDWYMSGADGMVPGRN